MIAYGPVPSRRLGQSLGITDFLARAGVDWSMIQDLCDRGKLIETKFEDHIFYMRRLKNMHNKSEEAWDDEGSNAL